MTAQEMFEELGYELVENNEEVITYIFEDLFFIRINFWKEDMTYDISQGGMPLPMSMKLHKAINQQLLEMGWIE